MASSSFNPFCEDEDSGALAPSQTTLKPKGEKKKREARRGEKKPTKKKESTPVPKNLFSSGSESEVETPPTTPTVKRRKTFFESEEESKPLRAAKLRSFLSQRVASGYTTQSDPSKRGNYFLELRVYNADEVEKIPATERWKHAICTVKLATNYKSVVWKSLTKLINDSKDELKHIQPILYPANEK